MQSSQAGPALQARLSSFLSVLCICAVCACVPGSPPSAQGASFVLEEATIAEIHAAFASGALTCQQLVTDYLTRIEAYDDAGPALNAILTLNPRALETAAAMDARYAADPSGVGPLHCVPMIIKGPGIAPGSVSDVPVIAMDVFATIADLAGSPYDMHDGIEGTSLVPLFENAGDLPEGISSLSRQHAENGELFFHYTNHPHLSSAVIDGEYKLVKTYGVPGPNARNLHLFHIGANPHESDRLDDPSNLADQMPQLTAQLQTGEPIT